MRYTFENWLNDTVAALDAVLDAPPNTILYENAVDKLQEAIDYSWAIYD